MEMTKSSPLSSFLYFLFFFFFFFLLISCSATNTLKSFQSIRDSETLVSENDIFELGFFSPGNSSNRYVGIWCRKIPDRKFVWVANRQNPLTDSSGVLTIGADGNMVIVDGNHKVFWSTNISISLNCTSSAVLSDNGNLQLREGGSDGGSNGGGLVLWESFGYPSNTFIQGMRIGINIKTGQPRLVTSWKSEDDPAPGMFSFGLDPHNQLQAIIWNGTMPYWRSGDWNGQHFIGTPDVQDDSLYLNGATLVKDDQEGMVYFSFSPYNNSSVWILELGSSGIFRKLELDYDKGGEWNVEWWGPANNGCDIYNKCGPFGKCNGLDSKICGCLRRFQPKYKEAWDKGDWSGGCVRRSELGGCGKKGGDGFLKMEKMKLPDFGYWVDVPGGEECGKECLNNCSCVAHAYVSGIGCLHWAGDLVDIQQFSPHGDGEDLFIRVAHSELRKKKTLPMHVIVTIIIFGVTVILVTPSCILYWIIAKERGTQDKNDVQLDSITIDASKGSSNAILAKESFIQEGSDLPLYNLDIIILATNNFSDANKIGEGGFGPVYKGKIQGGQEIAVKRLSKYSGQGLEEFKNEVLFISKLQHRNLVRLLGCCIENEEKILLYEYMPNKSLDSFLFDPKRQALLGWTKRFHIVEGITRGLLYLHRDSRLRIIHRDLKASNILLDEEMNPKISDFGMASYFGGNPTTEKTYKVAGTFGYMAPEYAREGQFSEKSDVFSFGVLLLEIVSGKRSSYFYHEEESLGLLQYAWQLWNENKVSQFIDPALGDSYCPAEVMRCVQVGLLCVQKCASDRPTMSTIVFMLGSETTILSTPMEPAANYYRSPSKYDEPFVRNIFSTNNLTATTIYGR